MAGKKPLKPEKNEEFIKEEALEGAVEEETEQVAYENDKVKNRKPKTKKKRGCLGRILALFGMLIIAAIIAAFIFVLEARTKLMPAAEESAEIEVTIPKGAGAAQIGRILEEAGVIRSAEAFRYLVQFKKTGSKLKAGEQVLDPSMNAMDVMNTLIKGNFKLYPVTIPEGLRMTEVAQIVSRSGLKGLEDKNEFLRLCHDRAFIRSLKLDTETLEGYLFPETYNFTKAITTKEAIKAMVGRFWDVWKKYEKDAASNKLSMNEIVTLASIVEKETGQAVERPLIASVFLNRLEKGMRLETDPTVIYGIKDFDGNLTRKHLQTPTPYNTYVIKGLPPGPIANPGEASIRAVLEPAESDFLFFVSKNDGTHFFSKTLKEHNRAVNQYQKSLRRDAKKDAN